MKLRYKITGGLLMVVTVAIASLATVMSHTSPCAPAPELAADSQTMKAIVYRCYGSPDILNFEDVEKPTPGDNSILVRIHAASVNPLDWHYMRGSPYIVRLGAGLGAPDDSSLGVDFAGTVEEVGKNVSRFKPGDEVFGGRTGAFAEFVTVHEDGAVVLKPADVSFEQAASVPIAALTALQALRDNGQLISGQNVLINGASGGVGTFAVQIAKSMGANVTGVCSTRNLAMVKSIGADHVIDYTKEDYTELGQQFDLIVDLVGNRSLSENRKVLKSEGRFVIVGGPPGDWLGPMISPIKAMLLSPWVDQEFSMILAKLNKEDLAILGDLIQAGKVTPVFDSRYTLSEVPAAIRHSEDGHARGKIIVAIHPQ